MRPKTTNKALLLQERAWEFGLSWTAVMFVDYLLRDV
jgi:hypothetical protein